MFRSMSDRVPGKRLFRHLWPHERHSRCRWPLGMPIALPSLSVSRGVGTSLIPVRLGAVPEVAVFEWALA